MSQTDPVANSPLTRRQRAFVECYISNGLENAAKAYRVAYPTSRKWSAQAVAEEASKLLRNPKIHPIIEVARAEANRRTEGIIDRYAVSKDRIIRELAAIAFADARSYMKWSDKGVVIKPSDQLSDIEAAAISEITETRGKDGSRTIRLKLGNKVPALACMVRVHDQMALEIAQRGDQANPEVLQQQEKARKMLMDLLQQMGIPEPLTIDGE
jgi:phage terminase small subunit